MQVWASLHFTVQAPVQVTWQFCAASQFTVLPAPTVTVHNALSLQEISALAPAVMEHVEPSQLGWRFASHAIVQVFI